MSQNPSRLIAVMAVEVQMSKIKATAPPCRLPPILHSCFGTVKLYTTRELWGSFAVGLTVTDSRFKMCGRNESCPWSTYQYIRRAGLNDASYLIVF